MKIDFPTILYLLVTGIVILELLGSGMNQERLYSLFVRLRILTCLAGITFIGFSVGRSPLFGPFEAVVYIGFIMGCLAWVFQKNWGYLPGFSLVSSLIVLIILLLQLGKPMGLNEDYFMYGNPWVNLFFNFRLVTAAFLAHGASQYLSYLFGKGNTDLLVMGGRNTLLAGASLYLVSEWAGSLWCMNWLGDSWQWSGGFLKSSILFLLIMVVCHPPQGTSKNKFVQGVSGTLPGIFILWMIFYH